MRALALVLLLTACGGSSENTTINYYLVTGGDSSTGGHSSVTATIGTGGAVATGGNVSTGGAKTTGGEPAPGGAAATGGMAATGGAATGGTTGLIAGTNYTTFFGLGTSLNCCLSGQVPTGAYQCYDCPASGSYGCTEVSCTLGSCDSCFHACANLKPLSGRNYVFINSCGAAP